MDYVRNAFLYSLLAGAIALFLILPVTCLEQPHSTCSSSNSKNGMSFSILEGTVTFNKTHEPYLLSVKTVDFDMSQKNMLMSDLSLKNADTTQHYAAEQGSLNLSTHDMIYKKVTSTTPQMITHAESAHFSADKNEWIFEGIITRGAFAQPHGMQPPL